MGKGEITAGQAQREDARLQLRKERKPAEEWGEGEGKKVFHLCV